MLFRSVSGLEPAPFGAQGSGVGLGEDGLRGVVRMATEFDDDEEVDDALPVGVGHRGGEPGGVERFQRGDGGVETEVSVDEAVDDPLLFARRARSDEGGAEEAAGDGEIVTHVGTVCG